STYRGIKQSALGYLLQNMGEDGISKIKTLELACGTWNCVSNSWGDFGEHVKVVHLMTTLKQACLGYSPLPAKPQSKIRQIAQRWRDYERIAKDKAEWQSKNASQKWYRQVKGGTTSRTATAWYKSTSRAHAIWHASDAHRGAILPVGR